MSAISIGERRLPPTFVYGYIEGQLSRLISRFGLEGQRAAILGTYQLICLESLAIPLAQRPPSFSRINEDGTPFQFSLALGASKSPLQFLSEAGVAGDNAAARLRANSEALHWIASLLDAEETLLEVTPLIDEMVPGNNPDLLADPSGAIWIGAGFVQEEAPKLKIYLNTKWGREADQWKRMDSFASHFNAASQWGDAKAGLKQEMQPLGLSITISRGQLPSGRIYLSAYGKPMAYYEALAEASAGSAFLEPFGLYTETLLGENRQYPTESIVCSFGFDACGSYDFKFEMCGLRIFESDADAMARCVKWLKLQKIEPSPYLHVLQELSGGTFCSSKPRLHCYLGLGAGRESIYSTFYFNPGIWNA